MQLRKSRRFRQLTTKRPSLIIGGLLFAASFGFAQNGEFLPNQTAGGIHAANPPQSAAWPLSATQLVPSVAFKYRRQPAFTPAIAFAKVDQRNDGITPFGPAPIYPSGALYLPYLADSPSGWADRLANGAYFLGAHHEFSFGTIIQGGVASPSGIGAGSPPASDAVAFAFGFTF